MSNRFTRRLTRKGLKPSKKQGFVRDTAGDVAEEAAGWLLWRGLVSLFRIFD